MNKSFIITIFFLINFVSQAQETPEIIIQKFFSEFKKNSDKAITDIYATNIFTSGMADAINNMKKIAKSYPTELGENHGFELITQQNCTSSFILYSYLVKYNRQPMKFTFEFYKPNNTWVLYSLNFDSTIDEDVEQAAKLYYLDKYK